MGQIWSRVRKKPSTLEVLEDLEKEIEGLDEYRRNTVQQQKRFIGSLIFYSVFLYIVIAAIGAFILYKHTDVKVQVAYVILLIFFPILIWLIRRVFHWYFRRKLEQNTDKLGDLLRKRKSILNEVKEKETYKKATEILEKFDPEYKKKQKEAEEAAAAAAVMKTPVGRPGTDPRRRPMTASSSFRGRGRGASPPPSSAIVQSTTPFGSTFSMNGGQQQWPRPPGPPLPRPILPREQKVVDRFVDFLVGDGPSNRYALICQRCLSHNGMALREEFEFLSFRCCYCYALNPARKVRPFAPRLPSIPIPAISLPTASEDSQEDSVTESDSESTKKGDDSQLGGKLSPTENEQTVEISEIHEETEFEQDRADPDSTLSVSNESEQVTAKPADSFPGDRMPDIPEIEELESKE